MAWPVAIFKIISESNVVFVSLIWSLSVSILLIFVDSRYLSGGQSDTELAALGLWTVVTFLASMAAAAAAGEPAPSGSGPSAAASRRLVGIAVAVLLSAAAAVAISTLLPALPYSRRNLAIAAVACGGLVALWHVVLVRVAPKAGAVVAALLAIAAAWSMRPPAESATVSVESARYRLRVTASRWPRVAADTSVEGGGLTRVGDLVLLVTGKGTFARLRPHANGTWQADTLPLASPANADAFAREAGPFVFVQQFRVVDLVAERRGDSLVVWVSHHVWDPPGRCTRLRVSRTSAPLSLAAFTQWVTAFDAQPCLPLRQAGRGVPFVGAAAGGRMVRGADGFLLTVGDFTYDGLNDSLVVSQDSTSSYGKTIWVPDVGRPTTFSIGHRNPQGLARAPDGSWWSTEHGPQGGDELNRLTSGANYGWPWRTYGTEYGLRTWPLLRPASDAWEEPRYAWVPSIGVSNLIAADTTQFPAWRDALLVGSLRARSLFVVHVHGASPRVVERIELGHEIRDLEWAADGTLLAWTDDGALLSLAPDAGDETGAALAAQCSGCHALNPGQRGGLGPGLAGIVGRPVASVAGFAYSPALRAYGGRWTRDRLDAFVANPAGAVPGTAMAFPGVRDSAARRALIDFLDRGGH